MNRTVGVEKSSTHGRLVISRSLGIVDFITPAIKKNAASTPCRIHSATFIADFPSYRGRSLQSVAEPHR
jgi:hypothetical protein